MVSRPPDRPDLSRADLSLADLSGADLYRAILTEAIVDETIFGNLDLRTMKGLETIHHDGPSTIGTDTIMRSKGNIPDVFLRKAGLSDTFITYARSLAQNPIEYYTCFISYSSKDQAFAERLYDDLQRKGVRCWFAPEDMKTGDKIRHRIDESIRLYDKLLLVLSEQSIASTWVEHEVEMALAKEQKVKRTVLFPIRLDTAIMDMQ
ncbi:MAG TPA: TIR domain-containing protein [Ktedonobacteraceae bacterium]